MSVKARHSAPYLLCSLHPMQVLQLNGHNVTDTALHGMSSVYMASDII